MTKEFSGNICLELGCSECCNPVKVNVSRVFCLGTADPFLRMECILVPERHHETIRLAAYRCKNFNSSSGLCRDYDNRPEVCRNTRCLAFAVASKEERLEIIARIKGEKFIRVPFGRRRM